MTADPAAGIAPATGIALAANSWLKGQHDQFAELVLALARAESPSTEPELQGDVREILIRELTGLGLTVELVPGGAWGPHILARPPGGRIDQLLLGHLDTVWPSGTLATMPAECVARGPEWAIRGPGVFDMKGGLAVGLFALRAMEVCNDGADSGLATGFLINADEEIGSSSSAPMIDQLACEVGRVFVLEPALGEEGALKTRRKGVGCFAFTVEGVASHSGLAPADGASAVHAMAEIVGRVVALNDPARGVTVNVGVMEGGTRSNVVAARARAEVDVRVWTGRDARRLEAAVGALRSGLSRTSLAVTGGIEREALERTPRNTLLWESAREIGRHIGLNLEQGVSGGGSDGNITSLRTATLDGLGAVGDGAHADHEFLYLERTIERAALLAGLLALPRLPDPVSPESLLKEDRASVL